ncbi:hypothetical protein StoSoilA2_34800 [Arthrobacter sp. StoSoilA2]|nr:hypothetical protein StoSoilA2_34800 [Arthrobacter sp. StoSoilA2]BCW49656.1 hypothetical protein StoSoilB13_19980 [Arthrobacter sp. StoSoilB13]
MKRGRGGFNPLIHLSRRSRNVQAKADSGFPGTGAQSVKLMGKPFACSPATVQAHNVMLWHDIVGFHRVAWRMAGARIYFRT